MFEQNFSMQLLPEDKLIWSPIVANSRMNRERNSSGINSYEMEFKFKPEKYLELKIKESGRASWLDLCCGRGNALQQTAAYLSDKGLLQNIILKGIDLLDTNHPPTEKNNCISFNVGSVVNWVPDQQYDLITCVHGIHYLGDKLKVIETAIGALSAHGMFIANLDLASIVIKEADAALLFKNLFRQAQVEYNSRTRIIKCVGNAALNFGVSYIGADDSSGPNYTGQDAVTSFYSIK